MPYGEDTLKVNIIGDASKLKGALSESEVAINQFASKVGSIGRTMTIIGAAVTAVSVGLIKMASDAEETASKFAVVFQDVSEQAAKSAKNLAENFGLSSNAAKELLGDTGDLLTGFGFTGEAALDLSTKVNELAVDLASFTNYSGGAEGASKALTKALLGERESVKSLGISIMEVDVQAKILEMTQKGLTFETERQAKAVATLTLMQEQSKNAIGDFARTSESFANQMRILKARVSDLAVALGEKLLPMATKMVNKAVEIVEKMTAWVNAHPKLVEWITKLAFTLGIIAAVGGPILMAASAFMRVKTVVDSVTFALKLLNVRMGTTAAISASSLIPSLASLNLALVPAAATLGLVAANVYIWKDAIEEMIKVSKMNKVTAEDVTRANQITIDMQEKVAEKLGITVEQLKEHLETTKLSIEPTNTFAASNKILADNLGAVADKAKEATEGIIGYADKITREYIALSIAATESWAAFYEFWELEAKMTAEVVEKTIDEVARKMYKVLNAAGQVIGLTNIQQTSPGQTLVPIGQGPSTINGEPVGSPGGGVTPLTPWGPFAPGGNTSDALRGVTVNINNPVVRNDDDINKIKVEVQRGFVEAGRQFDRSGEVIPGMA